MAKDITHAMIQNVDGSNHVKTLHAAPANARDLSSLAVVINHKHQLTVWFPKELPIKTAQSMANSFSPLIRRGLPAAELRLGAQCFQRVI